MHFSLRFLLGALTLTAIFAGNTAASSLPRIDSIRETIGSLGKEYQASIERFTQSPGQFHQAQNQFQVAYASSSELFQMDRELESLATLVDMALLVSNTQNRSTASMHVSNKKSYILKSLDMQIRYFESTLGRTGDESLTKLLLRTRDLMREARSEVEKVLIPWK